jgi:hypothetical protein
MKTTGWSMSLRSSASATSAPDRCRREKSQRGHDRRRLTGQGDSHRTERAGDANASDVTQTPIAIEH